MAVTCIDLRPPAEKHRWRWQYDESFKHEADPEARGDGRWYVEVLCRRGIIYPFGGDDLLAFAQTRGVLAQLLALDPSAKVHQRGEGEVVVRFPSRILPSVALVMRPRRKRTLDPERARAMGRSTAFPGAQVPEGEPGSTQRAGGGSGAVGGAL